MRPALVGPTALLLVACGSADTISASPTTPSPAISPSACDLLSDADITAAFTIPPAAGSSSSSSATEPTITHVYSVEKASIDGTKTIGQCTWSDGMGAQVILEVVPNTEVTKVAAYVGGSTQVGPAYIQEGDGRGFVSVERGSDALAISLVLTADPGVRTAHLADLARAASGAAVPTITPGAIATASSSSTSASSGPGQTVTGQTAATIVKEQDSLSYNPTSVTIQAGQVLEWDNSGAIAHNVTFDDYPTITSDTMNGGGKYQVKFTQPGTYKFHCTFHPGMNGQVTVS